MLCVVRCWVSMVCRLCCRIDIVGKFMWWLSVLILVVLSRVLCWLMCCIVCRWLLVLMMFGSRLSWVRMKLVFGYSIMFVFIVDFVGLCLYSWILWLCLVSVSVVFMLVMLVFRIVMFMMFFVCVV